MTSSVVTFVLLVALWIVTPCSGKSLPRVPEFPDSFSSGLFAQESLPRRALKGKSKKIECPLQYAPYVCSIRDLDGNHICGGVVISEDAVLTSAYCVDRRTKSNLAALPAIHIGGLDSDSPVQKRVAVEIIIHEDWDGNLKNGHDLAILKLDKPTCVLPVKFIGEKNKIQDTFTGFGYGRLSSTGAFSSSELQGSNVTYLSTKQCNSKLDVPVKLKNGSTCFVTTAGNAGMCTGGPIMNAPFTPVYNDSLIATISYTVGACDDVGSFTVATDISYYKTWIEGQLETKSSKPEKKSKKGNKTK